MKIAPLLLAAALVPAAAPSPAVAHVFCASTTLPDPDCQDDENHDCTLIPAENPVLIVCVGQTGH